MRHIKFLTGVTIVMLLALSVGRVSALGPPENPGNSGVIRFTDGLGFYFIDYESGLMSFHGIQTSWDDLCAGSPPVFDPLDFQLIFSPTGTLHALITAQAHTVWVYPAGDFPDPNQLGDEACPIILSLPLLAKGQARLVRPDNDLFGSEAPGADSFGMSSTGMLEDMVHGGTIAYREIFQALVMPNTEEFKLVKLSIMLSSAGDP